MMRTTLARALVLACGVTLALPPGWCCILGVRTRPHVTKVTTAPHCPGCCHRQPAEPLPGDLPPAPPRMPVFCCCPVNARVPPSPNDAPPQPRPRLASAFVPPAPPPPAVGPVQPPDSGHDVAVPVHVLRCVWLC